jgi:hypothetical protein
MKLDQVPNLRSEDFPSDVSWLNSLFIQLNPFIQGVSRIFLQNVSFGDNIKSVSQSYSITTFQEFSFQWPYKDVPPAQVQVIQATSGTNQTPTILLAVWSFDKSQNTITVSRLTEVGSASVAPVSGRYTFTVRATV